MEFLLFEDLQEEEIIENIDFPHKTNKRAFRRKKNESKANRKEKLAKELYPGWNAPHGYFRKGKIHCSCPSCTSKTNTKINKSRGPICYCRNFSRLSITNERYGKKNYKPSDKRKVDSLINQLTDSLLI